MGILPQASTFASRADQIFLAVFLLSMVFLVGITALMIYFVVRYNRKRHPKAAQIEGHVGLEVTWTVVPLLLFVAIFYFGWTNYDYSRRAPRDAMVVKVTGRQWAWMFQYPNGKQTTRLFAAINRPLKVEVQSADVVHGFYIPAFRLKVDAVPGRTTTTWFEPTKLGSFDIQCTVICGVDHSAMLSSVDVVTEDAFKAWYFGPEGTPEPSNKDGPVSLAPERVKDDARAALAAKTSSSPSGSSLAPSSGSATAGADPAEAGALALLRSHQCVGCHSFDGTPMTGPTFKGLGGREEVIVRDGAEVRVTMNEAEIQRAISESSRDVVKGYPPMPPVALTTEQVKMVAGYIARL